MVSFCYSVGCPEASYYLVGACTPMSLHSLHLTLHPWFLFFQGYSLGYNILMMSLETVIFKVVISVVQLLSLVGKLGHHSEITPKADTYLVSTCPLSVEFYSIHQFLDQKEYGWIQQKLEIGVGFQQQQRQKHLEVLPGECQFFPYLQVKITDGLVQRFNSEQTLGS